MRKLENRKGKFEKRKEKTESLAKSMREFNPTPTWQMTDLEHEEVAAQQKSN